MSERKTSGLIERSKQEMEDTYQFHEQGRPGRLLNHVDLLFAMTAGKVSRYIIVPVVGFQSFRDGIAEHMKETVMIGGVEATLFILFSAYFARIKKRQLLQLISQEGIAKTAGRIGIGYGKGRVLSYIYLYKLAMIFAEGHPKLYHSSMKYSMMVQNALRGIL